MAGHLGVNIDVASTVFQTGGMPLLDFLLDTFKARDVNDLLRIRDLQNKISQEVKGVNVITTHRGDSKRRFKIGKASSETSETMIFEDKSRGKNISVYEYFKEQYGITIKYPQLPLVMKANGKTAFPIEFLRIVPAERFMKRLNGPQTSDMIKATVQKPVDRERSIQQGVEKTLRYDENPYLESLGMQISREMIKIPARVLDAPEVLFAGNRKLSGRDGAWNMRGVQVIYKLI